MTASTNDVFNSQASFATATLAQSQKFLDLVNGLAQLSTVTISPLQQPTFQQNAAGGDITATQNLIRLFRPQNPGFLPARSDRPTFTPQTIDKVPTLIGPDFTGVAPVLTLPAVPSNQLPSAPSQPSADPVAIPPAPFLVFPTLPTVQSIVIPDAPAVLIPQFNAAFPVDNLVVPTNTFGFAEAPYQDAMLDAAKAMLLSNLQSGGYGIETADENALWQRARDRETENMLDAVETIMTAQAARGFPLPPGSAQVQLDRAVQASTSKISSINRDIAVKRGDLYVENRKFTLSEVRQLETILIQYYMSQMERALNVAKLTLDFGIQLYNANISRFNVRVQAYVAQVQAFEAQIRAALALVEQFRTVMEGKRIQAEIQRQFIDIYRAQLEGVQAQVGIYRTQMEAAQVQASIERLKIDAFRAAVEAYAQQVAAKVAEFQMYDAQIKGQTSLVESYRVQAQAYAAVVGGFEAKVRAAQTVVEAQARSATIALDSYKTDLERYKIDLDTQIRVNDNIVAQYGAQVQEYNADIGAITESYKLAQASYQIDSTLQLKNADVAIANARVGLEAIQVIYNVKGKAADASATFYGSIIAGATSALNMVVSAAASAPPS